jgi:serine/threonine protein kinase
VPDPQPPPVASDSLPERIGNFLIIGRLGQGGMATVYRAEQGALKRQVALKVVLPAHASDPAFRERFLREAQASAAINHPNVITCYDAGEADGQLYMAMELVGGGDLLSLMERRGGRLDEAQVFALAHDCLAGLEAIASAGLIHRDVKPANIFLTDRGQAKIADLGLVRPLQGDQQGEAGLILGTPAYIAPEQANSIPDLDIRADLYSLGATIFHLLTGTTVYSGDGPVAMLLKVMKEPLPDPRSRRPDLSAAGTSVIMRLMAKDRAQRYPDPQSAREDVGRLLSGGAVASAAMANQPPVELPEGFPKTGRFPPNEPPTRSAGRAISATTSRHSVGTAMSVDSGRLAALAKRVVVDKAGLKAAIVLAPKASFPRYLLEKILECAGVTFGLQPDALEEATRPQGMTRRIVLARGEPPQPGRSGWSVLGAEIPPPPAVMAVHVSEDHMTVIGVVAPGQLVPKGELPQVLRSAELRYGFDPDALRLLCDGPPPSDGRAIIARGLLPMPARPAGFHLAHACTPQCASDGSPRRPEQPVINLSAVVPGTVLTRWSEAEPGREGMDVHGHPLPAPAAGERTSDACAGEGTAIEKGADGELRLLATSTGLVQQRDDGLVRVVVMREVHGDLTAADGPIDSDEVVVVRGNIQDGAKISSRRDVVVLGNLGNAAITTGGSLSVSGSILPGDQPIVVGGELSAAGSQGRNLVAASVNISGEAKDCDIQASGDVMIRRVIGGKVAGGGSITVEIAGDADGTVTELWAGHALSPEQQLHLAQLVEARQSSERTRLLGEVKTIETELADAARTQSRLDASTFTRQDVLKKNRQRLKLLEDNLSSLYRAAENSRKAFVSGRAGPAPGEAAAGGQQIAATQLAHEGVVVRLASGQDETIAISQAGFLLQT